MQSSSEWEYLVQPDNSLHRPRQMSNEQEDCRLSGATGFQRSRKRNRSSPKRSLCGDALNYRKSCFCGFDVWK
ncbi:unnamed protein product [Rodentolepis nana]|uniref:Uncharacterized protein n=1 Tax=Rodentolepis nana TaxID=102285 RepID=A0A0R3TFP2_RODNA|nr:unnamed protein product [Rodentolepis nana]